MTLTDEQLHEEYCESGREELVAELVRRYLPKVRRIVFPMVLDHASADDITQEIMIRAVRGLSNFKGDARLSTWITRIALNTTYTFLERRKRQSAEQLPAATIDKSFAHSPMHVAIGNELDEQIQSALQQLSAKLRAAIVLTAIQGASAGDAAEIEQCPVSTMHWRIHEARKQLRNHLKEYVHIDSGDS